METERKFRPASLPQKKHYLATAFFAVRCAKRTDHIALHCEVTPSSRLEKVHRPLDRTNSRACRQDHRRTSMDTLVANLDPKTQTTAYQQTNLVSDGFVPARVIDPNLINPWGVSRTPAGPF